MQHPCLLIYDRTLRKSSSQDYFRYSESTKLKYLERLDKFRIDYVEIAPCENEADNKKLGEKIFKHKFKHAKPCAYGDLVRIGLEPEKDPQLKRLLDLKTSAIELCINPYDPKSSDATLLERIASTTQFFKQEGKEVLFCVHHFFDLYQEDSSRAQAIIKLIAETAPLCIILSDTFGGTLPSTLRPIIKAITNTFSEIAFGLESYNDCGLANALALEAAESGLNLIQGTFNGLGERAGCTDLSTIIPNLSIKLEIPINCKKQVKDLTDLSIFVDEITNNRHNAKAPYVGKSAFTLASHYEEETYPPYKATAPYHIDPGLVGNQRHFSITQAPNESIIVKKAQELNLHLEPDTLALKYFVNELKELKTKGFEYEAADASLRLLLNQKLLHKKSYFQAIGYRIVVGKSTISEEFLAEATVKIKVGTYTYHTVAEGNGPVSALDHALRKALKNDYPQINQIRLTDFKVGILDSSLACDSQTRVYIETSDGTHSWNTIGASDNIIEASWQALRDAFEYKLFLDDELSKTPSKSN